MTQSLYGLQGKLQQPEYKPLSEQQIRERAENQYKNIYDEQVLGAKHEYEVGELGYEKQLAQIGISHDSQISQVKEQTKHAVSDADRHSLSRGMQRSSYNVATLSNINLAGNHAQAAIGESRARAEGDVAAERTLKAQQLAQTLKQAKVSYETSVSAYADTLRDKEAQRALDASRYQNELLMAMYEYENAATQQQQQQARWEAEFNEQVRQFNESQQLKAAQSQKTSSSKKSSGSTKKTTSFLDAAIKGLSK